MLNCKFIDKATGETIFRSYKFKQPHEIKAIAKRSGWQVVYIMKEF